MTTTPKIPPEFDGMMSWFEYEQRVVKARLTGLAEKHKELLDNQLLECPGLGVEYFKRFLRPYFVKGVLRVYLYRFLQA